MVCASGTIFIINNNNNNAAAWLAIKSICSKKNEYFFLNIVFLLCLSYVFSILSHYFFEDCHAELTLTWLRPPSSRTSP